jgi:hypothetical protein
MKNISVILFALVILSCNQYSSKQVNKEETKFFSFPKNDNIKFKVISDYRNHFPGRILLHDSLLIIHHEMPSDGDYWINIVNRNGENVQSLFKNGKDPNESLGLNSSGFMKEKFWVLDYHKKELLIIKDLFDRTPLISRFKLDLPLFNVQVFNDSILATIANCTGPHHKIDFYNYIQNEIISGAGELNTLHEFIDLSPAPQDVEYDFNLMVEKGVFSANINMKPDMSRIAVAYDFFDALEIYSTSGQLIKALRGPMEISPTLKTVHDEYGSGLVIPENTILGYRSMYCTNNYIFASFSGNNYYDYNAEKIFVIDWNGNPIARFGLNFPIGPFCVDERSQEIISISTNTGELIKGKYRLP